MVKYVKMGATSIKVNKNNRGGKCKMRKKKIAPGMLAVIAVFLILALIEEVKKNGMAVSVIGGADGPTSIFLAGKVGMGMLLPVVAVGIVIIAVCLFLVFRKK